MRVITLSIALLFVSATGHAQSVSLGALHVDVTTHAGDQARFVEGSGVSFLVSLNRPAYIALIFRNASGKRVQLYPTPSTPLIRQDAGVYLPFAHFSQALRVSPPFGRETLTVIASNRGAFPTRSGTPDRDFREIEWSDSQWGKWLSTYPAQCKCEFAVGQVSFTTFADGISR